MHVPWPARCKQSMSLRPLLFTGNQWGQLPCQVPSEEAKREEMEYTRREMERTATDRQQWRSFGDAYAPSEQTGIIK